MRATVGGNFQNPEVRSKALTTAGLNTSALDPVSTEAKEAEKQKTKILSAYKKPLLFVALGAAILAAFNHFKK